MKSRKEIGSITIEATISLTVFMFAFLGITSLTSLVRAESKIQYALNQATKEFSQYMYIFYRADEFVQNGDNATSTKAVDELIDDTSKFSEMIKSSSLTANSGSSGFSKDNVIGDFQTIIGNVTNDAESIISAGNSLAQKYAAVYENPTEVLNGIYAVLKGEVVNTIRSKVVAPVVGNILMPKYLSSDGKSADQYLKSIGIENGMNGLNFSLSNIMEDGRTINMTVVYTVKYKIPLIGEHEFVIKQTASTAAWSKDKPISDIKTSTWDKANSTRGKEIIDNIKSENSAFAVNTNKTNGIHLYDFNSNTATKIISIDTNSASYLTSDMKLNEATIKSKFKTNANELISAIEAADKVVYQNGKLSEIDNSTCKGIVQVYIPKGSSLLEEAQKYADEISSQFENVTIKVNYYQE